jgi:hypothetical protein
MSIAVTVLAPPVFATIAVADIAVQVQVQGPVAVQIAVLGIQGAPGIGGTPSDDEATGSATTWSSERIVQEIRSALDDLAAGAPGALDTLSELAAALGNDANFAATVTTALGARVRTDTNAQGLTAPQQANARANIGAAASADIGNPETDFVATFNTGLL